MLPQRRRNQLVRDTWGRRDVMRHLNTVLAISGSFWAALALGQNAPRTIEYPDPPRIETIGVESRRLDLGLDADFLRVTAILPRSDGRFIVVNSGTSELRFYDASGRRYSAVGRRGEGPGEYQRITT